MLWFMLDLDNNLSPHADDWHDAMSLLLSRFALSFAL
jgi:hypothetical protein